MSGKMGRLEDAVKERVVREQKVLFSEDSLYPDEMPTLEQLRPARNLSSLFEDCHNHIYANEGLLKDKIFHEIVKLLVMKLHDEQTVSSGLLRFGIIREEYAALRDNQPNAFLIRLTTLYDAVRASHPRLFTDVALKLRPLSLAYVVHTLQYVNLKETPGDIKGEAFQSFVSRHQRGDRGEFFTPHPIVRLAVEMLAPRETEAIIDPACGSGGFLLAALSYVEKNVPVFERETYIRNCLRGIEFNPDVALSASVRLAFEGGSGDEIVCANALMNEPNWNGQFDVVLTNPPFGSKGKVEERRILQNYELARRWNKTSEHGFEISRTVLPGQSPDILFIERSMALLRPGGRMAIVLPDGILQNITNGPVRYWICQQAEVMGVVSIPQEAFIPYGTGVKTSVLFLQKHPSSGSSFCFMARMQKMGYDVKGQPIYQRNGMGKPIYSASGQLIIEDDVEEITTAFQQFRQNKTAFTSSQIYAVPTKILNSRLDAEHYDPADLRLITHLEQQGAKPLKEIAHILSESDNFRLSQDSPIRYIAISDVDARTMQVVAQQTIVAHEAPSRATYRVSAGDIITATSGASTGTTRQATALITEDEDGAICSNGFAVLRDIHGVEPLFLLAYLRTEHCLRQVRRLMTGHAIPSISQDDLARVLVPIPPLEEQKRIAQSVARLQEMRREAMRTGERTISELEGLLGLGGTV